MKPRQTTRLLGVGVTLIFVGSSVAGCTSSVSGHWFEPAPTVVELQDLNEVETLRDSVARTESALVLQGKYLDLPDLESSASLRLEAVGGMWDPWVEAREEMDLEGRVELPQSVESAPSNVELLAEYMLSSASEQLFEVAHLSEMDSAERMSIAGVLSGRVVSGTLLATAAGIGIPAPNFLDFAKAIGVDSATPLNSGTNQSPQAGQDASSANRTDGSESEVLVGFDCVATTLMSLSEPDSSAITNVRDFASTIEFRITTLRNLGINDQRTARCVLDGDNSDDVLTALIGLDLLLIGSENEEVRLLGASYLYEDSKRWATELPSTANTVTVLTQTLETSD